ncbi:hypothetical protein SANTM175S_07460 [Streptomyces antimycoticus]
MVSGMPAARPALPSAPSRSSSAPSAPSAPPTTCSVPAPSRERPTIGLPLGPSRAVRPSRAVFHRPGASVGSARATAADRARRRVRRGRAARTASALPAGRRSGGALARRLSARARAHRSGARRPAAPCPAAGAASATTERVRRPRCCAGVRGPGLAAVGARPGWRCGCCRRRWGCCSPARTSAVNRPPDVLTLPMAGGAAVLLGAAAPPPHSAGSWPRALLGGAVLGGAYPALFLISPSGMGFGARQAGADAGGRPGLVRLGRALRGRLRRAAAGLLLCRGPGADPPGRAPDRDGVRSFHEPRGGRGADPGGA